MHRFFCPEARENMASLTLTGDDARHVHTVLRLSPGELITVCDGLGKDFICAISAGDAKTVHADVRAIEANQAEPRAEIILYQGLPKADKMEWIIQKGTELGMTRLVPVITEFAVAKLTDKMGNKLARWQKIAEAAAKQSGRGRIPAIDEPIPFACALQQMQTLPCAIMAYEKAEQQSLKRILRGFEGSAIGICIGPEGGFSAEEAQKAAIAGIHAISLGKRILRTETAGPAILAMIQYEWEAYE